MTHPTAKITNITMAARLAFAIALGAASATGWAQSSPQASAPSAAASAIVIPPNLRSTPKVTGPSDAQRSMDIDHAQPEGKVTPQIRIGLGKKAPPPVFERQRPQSVDASASSGSIGDEAARCEAQRGEQVRAKCRDQLARQGAPAK